MRKLILVRHGETEINVEGKLHRYKDVEKLNTNGKRQIIALAKRLKKMKLQLKCIYVSKEVRAIESAKIISEEFGLMVREINGLHERNWGKYSGMKWEEIKKVLDPMTLEERYNFVPPDGESWKNFELRLIESVQGVLENNNEDILIVTHGGAIRALMPYLLNVPRDESFKYDPQNASITMFGVLGKKFKKILVDNTSHLRK
jgi:broad specificity phosphatase PhoE